MGVEDEANAVADFHEGHPELRASRGPVTAGGNEAAGAGCWVPESVTGSVLLAMLNGDASERT